MSHIGEFYEMESERLLLRKLSLYDLKDIYEYGCDDEVSKFVLWNQYESKDDAVTFAQYVQDNYAKGNNNIWAIEYKEDNKMIGTIDFVTFSEKYKRAELGYVLNRSYWNRGLMTEAVNMVLHHGFKRLDLNKISACAIDCNKGSYKVMEKVGMVKEGTSRQHYMKNSVYYDIVLYSILKSEYDQTQDKES